jgi:LysR family transcriptional regulator of gallate degradation
LRHGPAAAQPLVETGDLALVRGLLLQGDMVTALSAHQLRHEIDAGWLRELAPAARHGAQHRHHHSRGALSPGADALIAALRHASRSMEQAVDK